VSPQALPSLPVVLAEVRLEREERHRHFNALDSKAGILLGFAGALVALIPLEENLLVDLGRIASVLAAASALSAFWPRSYHVTNLRILRDRYLAANEVFTVRRIVDTQIAITDGTFQTIRSKVRRLKMAMSTLAIAAALVAVGLVVR
jgi:hypothetical protein